MAKSMSIINVNVPTYVKEEATEIFDNLGLNMSTAINMFLRRAIYEKGIPFEVREEPSDELKAALNTVTEALNKAVAEVRDVEVVENQNKTEQYNIKKQKRYAYELW